MSSTALSLAPTLPRRARNTLPATLYVVPSGPPPLPERYETLRVLGRGGMGEVRLVRDLRLGRVVAMKTVRTDLPFHRSRAARLVREALVQARLQHPAVVPVYDVGEIGGGETYFTMKRIRGRQVSSVLADLESGRTPDGDGTIQRKLLGAFATVCLATAYAHRHGIVHRDLKPDNVMLGEYGEVWLLDWGVAKALPGREPVAEASALPPALLDATEEGTFVGTPGYMAPEQLRDFDRVDERADVYSLGAFLFEILALEPLHRGDSVEQVMWSTMSGSDARLHVRAPRRLVRSAVEDVCLRATAQDPADRFSDARELLAALDGALR